MLRSTENAEQAARGDVATEEAAEHKGIVSDEEAAAKGGAKHAEAVRLAVDAEASARGDVAAEETAEHEVMATGVAMSCYRAGCGAARRVHEADEQCVRGAVVAEEAAARRACTAHEGGAKHVAECATAVRMVMEAEVAARDGVAADEARARQGAEEELCNALDAPAEEAAAEVRTSRLDRLIKSASSKMSEGRGGTPAPAADITDIAIIGLSPRAPAEPAAASDAARRRDSSEAEGPWCACESDAASADQSCESEYGEVSADAAAVAVAAAMDSQTPHLNQLIRTASESRSPPSRAQRVAGGAPASTQDPYDLPFLRIPSVVHRPPPQCHSSSPPNVKAVLQQILEEGGASSASSPTTTSPKHALEGVEGRESVARELRALVNRILREVGAETSPLGSPHGGGHGAAFGAAADSGGEEELIYVTHEVREILEKLVREEVARQRREPQGCAGLRADDLLSTMLRDEAMGDVLHPWFDSPTHVQKQQRRSATPPEGATTLCTTLSETGQPPQELRREDSQRTCSTLSGVTLDGAPPARSGAAADDGGVSCSTLSHAEDVRSEDGMELTCSALSSEGLPAVPVPPLVLVPKPVPSVLSVGESACLLSCDDSEAGAAVPPRAALLTTSPQIAPLDRPWSNASGRADLSPRTETDTANSFASERSAFAPMTPRQGLPPRGRPWSNASGRVYATPDPDEDDAASQSAREPLPTASPIRGKRLRPPQSTPPAWGHPHESACGDTVVLPPGSPRRATARWPRDTAPRNPRPPTCPSPTRAARAFRPISPVCREVVAMPRPTDRVCSEEPCGVLTPDSDSGCGSRACSTAQLQEVRGEGRQQFAILAALGVVVGVNLYCRGLMEGW
eukprot:TRINITY_DN1058_c0_g1_i2.p1 TRINITY_DN1058_c0_g1~~TRINITY_DN1058_c0_g1_i2.p1  ORF type:complete len:858 (+),score=187.67 TRINITY_DN1058_c0_g1_i2:1399-3972(+)